jgi:hypothetical protein
MSVGRNATNPDAELNGFQAGETFDEGLDLNNLDLSGVNEVQSFPVWPAGTYAARVEDCQFGYSKNSGKPQWTWQIMVTNPDTGRERKMFYYTGLAKDRLPQFKRALKAVAPDVLNGPINAETSAADMKGRFCQAKIRVEADDRGGPGAQRNSIGDLLPPAADDNAMSSFL